MGAGTGKVLTYVSRGSGRISNLLQNPVIGNTLTGSGTKTGLIGGAGFTAGTVTSFPID